MQMSVSVNTYKFWSIQSSIFATDTANVVFHSDWVSLAQKQSLLLCSKVSVIPAYLFKTYVRSTTPNKGEYFTISCSPRLCLPSYHL